MSEEPPSPGSSGPRRAPSPGSLLRAGKDGPQRVAGSSARWSEAAEQIFLDRLAASNNFTWAAAEVGFSRESIYARARRDPVFAEKMAAARAVGFAHIDGLLAEAAEEFLAGRRPNPDSPLPAMTVRDAIAIRNMHRAAQTGEGKRPAWPARPRSLEEVQSSILAKISAIARRRGLL